MIYKTTSGDYYITVKMEHKIDEAYLLIVFGPYVCYCEYVCLYTDYEQAIIEKVKLQEKIDVYQTNQKDYWKGRVWYPEPKPEYGNPKVEVVTIKYDDFNKVNSLYIDIIDKNNITTPLDKTPSTGFDCWFDFLKDQKKEFDKQSSDTITRTFYPMYLVIDFFLIEDYANSKVIGCFTDPETAYNVQSKVLASYGMDIVTETYDDKHYVPLYGCIDDTNFNPEKPYYKWC